MIKWRVSRYPLEKPDNRISAAIHDAFKFWEKFVNLNFEFSHSNADIEIYFMPEKHGHVKALEANEHGHAFSSEEGGNIHLNENIAWHESGAGGIA